MGIVGEMHEHLTLNFQLRNEFGAGCPRKTCVSAKRTHRFGRIFLVYHSYLKTLVSFAEEICRWVRFLKRTHRGGVLGVFLLINRFILGRKWVRLVPKLTWLAFEPLTIILSPGGERRLLGGAAAASIATGMSLPRSDQKWVGGGWVQELVSQAGRFG